jgi:CubicO group peptidase (beta-lactamase class C family)
MIQVASELVGQHLQQGLIPGAALGYIDLAGNMHTFYGGLKRLGASASIDRETYFDLASLTKVLFTVPHILKLSEVGLLNLDDPLGRFLPVQPDLSQCTLRQLITHTSGLPAWEAFYTWESPQQTLAKRIIDHAWTLKTQYLYSDIGYILLGFVLAKLGGELNNFALPPGLTFSPQPAQCAATENCPWRGRILQGEVHDENCFALGKATGHAGLFGSLEGVLTHAKSLMENYLSPAAKAEMCRIQHPERALGWVVQQAGFSGGSLCSPQTLGHTGFTGTGVWLDFGRGYAWALLTNRVHPSRHTQGGIAQLRQAVGNSIAAQWA